MVADEQAAQPLTFHHQCNECDGSLQSARGCMDHFSHGRLFDSDRANYSRKRAEPMGGVNHVGSGNTRKQIFSTPENPAPHVGSRTENDDVIVSSAALLMRIST